MRIGDFARWPRREDGLGQFLGEYLEGQECHTPGLRHLLDKSLEGGRCLVLLDGLDEVASAADRQAVVTAVTSFVTANSRQGNRFVVTSRIAGYAAAPLPPTFNAVRVQEMGDQTIEVFLAAYFPAIERAEAPRKSPDAVRRDAAAAGTELLDALGQNPGVRRLAANPLLLTALVLVHRARGRLPHRRVDAYVEVTEALGRTWRSVQGVPEAELPDDRILTRWLTRLGAWMHEYRPEGSASRRELLEVLGPLWAEHSGEEWEPALLGAADPLDSEAGRSIMEFVHKTELHTGLLVERAAGRYGFPHSTFEEYYAGRALAFEGFAADRPAAMRARLHDPRYDEPILLALGLVGRVQPEEIERLVGEAILGETFGPSPYEELLGRDFLFTLRVLADDVPLGTSTIDRLLQEALREWFAQASRCRFSNYAIALLERLRALGGTRGAVRLQLAIDRLDPGIAAAAADRFFELVRMLESLGPLTPVTTTAVINIAMGGDSAGWSRKRAVAVLGQAKALAPEAVAALVALASSDGRADVRMAAAQALGQAKALAPEAVATLVALASSDGRADVRMAAAQALGQAKALAPEAVATLVALASSDGRADVRMAAAQALGRIPDAVNALVALATGDDDVEVRRLAADALRQAQALTPNAVNALVALATGDDDVEVRRLAGDALRQAQALTPDAVNALVALVTGDDDADVRRLAGDALRQAQTWTLEAVAAMVALAGDDDAEVRTRAALALGQAEGLTADVVLALAAGDDDAEVGALTPEVVASLVMLAVYGDAGVRLLALETLRAAQALTPETITTLVALAAGAEDVEVQMRASLVLGQVQELSSEAVDALVALAAGAEDAGVQLQAALVLGPVQELPPDAVDALVALAAGDDDARVRVQVVDALRQAQALTPEAVAALVSLATTGEQAEVRVRAAEALGRARDPSPEAVAALVSLATTGEQAEIRVRAAEALSWTQELTSGVIAALAELVSGKVGTDIRTRAVMVLGRAGTLTPEVVSALLALLKSKSWSDRLDAATILGQADTSSKVLAALVALFADEDGGVREGATFALAVLARRNPSASAEIAERLVQVCRDLRFDKVDDDLWRPGWDYAHEALSAVAAVAVSAPRNS